MKIPKGKEGRGSITADSCTIWEINYVALNCAMYRESNFLFKYPLDYTIVWQK
jgi:hypothetical protein